MFVCYRIWFVPITLAIACHLPLCHCAIIVVMSLMLFLFCHFYFYLSYCAPNHCKPLQTIALVSVMAGLQSRTIKAFFFVNWTDNPRDSVMTRVADGSSHPQNYWYFISLFIVFRWTEGRLWCTILCNISESNEVRIKEPIKFISDQRETPDNDNDDRQDNNGSQLTNCEDTTDVDEDEDGSHRSSPEDDEELEVDDDCESTSASTHLSFTNNGKGWQSWANSGLRDRNSHYEMVIYELSSSLEKGGSLSR